MAPHVEILAAISIGVVFLPLIAGIKKWSVLTGRQKLFVRMLAFIIVNQMAGLVTGQLGYENLPFFHIYVLIEFTFLTLLYKRVLADLLPNRLFNVLIFLFWFTELIMVVWQESLFDFPATLRLVESCLVILYVVLFGVGVIRNFKPMALERAFLFWVGLGLLIYFQANILLSIFANTVEEIAGSEAYGIIWSIHSSLAILLYLSYFVALLCKDPN